MQNRKKRIDEVREAVHLWKDVCNEAEAMQHKWQARLVELQNERTVRSRQRFMNDLRRSEDRRYSEGGQSDA